jgi:hypothetical protein
MTLLKEVELSVRSAFSKRNAKQKNGAPDRTRTYEDLSVSGVTAHRNCRYATDTQNKNDIS